MLAPMDLLGQLFFRKCVLKIFGTVLVDYFITNCHCYFKLDYFTINLPVLQGLYPTQHGLVSNRFLNKNMDEYFLYEDEQHEDFDWFKGQPVSVYDVQGSIL